MNGFLDHLGDELRGLATQAAVTTPAPGAPARPRRSRPRRTALTLATTATVVVGLGTLPWVAERTDQLSPLNAPVANAAAHAGRPGIPPAHAYALARSHTFPTPDGSGFVVDSNDGRRRCLVVPDRLIPDSFGSTCLPMTRVERDGSLTQMVQPATAQRQGRALIAFLLPRGASQSVEVRSGNTAVPVTVAQGVAVAVAHDRATLSYRVRGQHRTRDIPAPFRETGRASVQCAGGRMVEFDIPAAKPSTRGAAPRLDATRHCDDG